MDNPAVIPTENQPNQPQPNQTPAPPATVAPTQDVALSPSTPDSNAPPRPKIKVIARAPAKAVIKWLDGQPETIAMPRNTLVILQTLTEKFKATPPEKLKEVTLSISTLATDEIAGKTIELTLFDGAAPEVMRMVASMAIPAAFASRALQGFITDPIVGLLDSTGIKAIMLTMLSVDAGVGGFSIISDKFPFEDGDAIMLASAIAGQLEQFKDKMRKDNNVKFPDDSAIITPGQAGFAPGGLRVIKGGRG